MGCLKSPGPNGMTGGFNKKSWNILKSDLVRVFQDFFKNGIIIRRGNNTYVCLIPKKKKVARVNDFKPISLVTSVCKVISKNGIINRRCNETSVCLIPEKKEVARVSDFRPISLVTSLYKVISRCSQQDLKKFFLR